MHFFKWLIGGVIGGAIGAAAWVGIENAMQTEYAWIAWPVGLLVGWGVHKGASADVRGGFFRGAVAAVIALAAIMGAKYAKTAVLVAQAEKAAAVTLDVSQVDTDPTTEESGTAPSGDITEILEDLEPPSTFQGGAGIQSGNAFQEIDMLWICLAAITAYVVGKGGGPSALPRDEDGANSDEQAEPSSQDEPGEE